MVVVLALPGVGEGGEGEGGQHQAGQPGDHVGRPPPVAEDVSRGDVDTEDEGEAVAVVDSPAEDTVGDSSGGGGEHLSDERAADRSGEGTVKMLADTELPADRQSHRYQHPEDDQVPVLGTEAHQEACQGEGGRPCRQEDGPGQLGVEEVGEDGQEDGGEDEDEDEGGTCQELKCLP